MLVGLLAGILSLLGINSTAGGICHFIQIAKMSVLHNLVMKYAQPAFKIVSRIQLLCLAICQLHTILIVDLSQCPLSKLQHKYRSCDKNYHQFSNCSNWCSNLQEEEDDYESDYSNSDTEETKNYFKPSRNNKDWHKTVAKDLVANLSRKERNEKKTKTVKKAAKDEEPSPKLVRRHSITLCQSRNRKITPPSSNECANSGPKSLMPVSSRKSSNVSTDSSRTSPSRDDCSGQDALKTLNLGLEEVAHIRSVLTKAQLEGLPLDGNIKDNVERGKICFVCMSTRFGLFCRAQKCEMCKQHVCSRCYSKVCDFGVISCGSSFTMHIFFQMRIPTEHFTATPVFALSPSVAQPVPQQPEKTFSSLTVTALGSGPHTPPQREKKLSLPASLNAFSLQSVGSAPNSPTSSRKSSSSSSAADQDEALEPPVQTGISTISGTLSGPPQSMIIGGRDNEIVMRKRPAKYATLPRK